MLDNFHPGRQGRLRENLSGNLAYRSFLPAPLQSCLPINLDIRTQRSISDCRALLGEMQGMARFIPNVGMYLTMYVRKEALLSSQIEGTQCTFDDVLDPSLGKKASRDLGDVVNYVRATEHAVTLMGTMPLCTRLLRSVHAVLLDGVRGAEKNPGELRSSQNWVGPAGCTLREAAFVPPNVEDMHQTLSDLEVFLNNEKDLEPVVKAALAHYQFETAHPFLDGNGRMGRLLITLSLMNDGVLDMPILYPSYELKRQRISYYEWLMRVRETGDYEGWVAFFCDCLLNSALDARNSMRRLADLHSSSERALIAASGRGSANALRLLDLLEGNPIVDVGFVAKRLSLSTSGANSLIATFERAGLLTKRDASRKRYRVFTYEPYLTILRAGDEPL
ncbi:Fic family protein [Thermophilibacter mediterraneus]|uniref:Fic family protein n=1 Tax=Thermophilibacter mediterraneus TaxID=1871031 RepID=UPI000931D0B6|nr:Fic/DOC family N-terminal domain-containing protein [Thermophilibacter mediterraneus]